VKEVSLLFNYQYCKNLSLIIKVETKMHKIVNLVHKILAKEYHFLIPVFIIFSCSPGTPDKQEISAKKNIMVPPVTIKGEAPFVTLLDTCPPPRTFTLPGNTVDSTDIKSKSGSNTILHPDEANTVGFFPSMQNYTTRQGLTNNGVMGSYMDKTGNIWVATFGGGVSRYDGKSFTNYTSAQGLPNNNVISICEDKNGDLWFGCYEGGVSRYDGKSFRNYTSTDGISNKFDVWAITKDENGNLWFGTAGDGISRYDGKMFTKYTTAQGLADNSISSILQDKRGNIWISTWANGVSCFNGKSFTNYTIADGLANNNVKCIFEDTKGNLWFGHYKGAVSWLDGKTKTPDEKPRFINYTIGKSNVSDGVNSITQDTKGNLWFGMQSGAYILDWDEKPIQTRKSFRSFTNLEGFANKNVNSILEDKNENLWFSTDGGGIYLLDANRKSVMSLTIRGELLNKVSNVLEDKAGNTWVGTATEGAMRLSQDGKSLTTYTTAQGLYKNEIARIVENKRGNVWISTWGNGLCYISADGKFLTSYAAAQGLPNYDISNIFEDKKENMWFASNGGGVSCLSGDGKSFTRYTIAQGLPDNSISNILEDREGNFWFGTRGGLSRLDHDGRFTNYTTTQGLPSNDISSILQDRSGDIWIGTWGGGLNRYDGKSFKSFTTELGLSEGGVSDIVMDKEGIIWLVTYKGFTALKGFVKDVADTFSNSGQQQLQPSNELSNVELENGNFKPVFEIYNYETGYPIEDITSNICLTREGAILAGTSEKLIRFEYSGIHKNPHPLNVFIQSIKIDNENICWSDLRAGGGKNNTSFPSNINEEVAIFGKALSDVQRDSVRKKFGGVKFDSITRFYTVPVNLVMPYAHNNITFDFAAIEPARPNLVSYQYMLEGYDNDWGLVNNKATTTFGNIQEGTYSFKLKARSPDGVWSKPVISTFKVLPPWYRTWWAFTLYALVFLTALWMFIKWRTGTLKKEKILLEEKVAVRTHELKEEKEKVESTLAELKSTQFQLIQSEKMASLGQLTAGIAHEIQNPLNFVNNFSEVNKELLAEMKDEIEKGNIDEVKALANDVIDNEEKINHHGKRADAIVKGMLQHSRQTSGTKEPTEINALCDEYLRLSYHGLRAKDKNFNADFKTDLDETIGKINIIPQEIGRVLLNLYNNAFYATNERKKTAGKEYKPLVTVQTKKINARPDDTVGRDKLEIKVSDNANGIPQNIIDKIFQPFFTTKPTGQGTGLGLSLSYDIIKSHGGEIKVETKEGEGSEFIITIPFKQHI
jgi:signal transduction histidine kinase/ligand-binding sensor domain-containing protein